MKVSNAQPGMYLYVMSPMPGDAKRITFYKILRNGYRFSDESEPDGLVVFFSAQTFMVVKLFGN